MPKATRAGGGAPTGSGWIPPAVKSRDNAPRCISFCKLPVDTIFQAEVYAPIGLTYILFYCCLTYFLLILRKYQNMPDYSDSKRTGDMEVIGDIMDSIPSPMSGRGLINHVGEKLRFSPLILTFSP